MRTWLPIALGVLAATPLGAQTVSMSKVDEATYHCQIDDYVTTTMRMNSLSGIPLVAPGH